PVHLAGRRVTEDLHRRGRERAQRKNNSWFSSAPSRALCGESKDSDMPLEPLETFDERESPDRDFLYTLNFGPQHPATHTTLRLILTLDGETIVRAIPDIGYLHSGFEKLGEDLDFNQYVTIVDRMNYISPVANEIAWHHVVEKLLD